MGYEHQELTDANREAWDAKAKTYDAKPWQKKLAAQVAQALQSHASWINANWTDAEKKKECRLLDYACGTGAVTRALADHITHSTGLDISSVMLAEYTRLLHTTHPALSIQTAQADLVSSAPQPQLDDKKFWDFDIAAVALGFHHFGDPSGCVKRLAQRLRKGGVVGIVDWLPSGSSAGDHQHGHDHGSEHEHGHGKAHEIKQDGDTKEWQTLKKTIKHNGFTEEDMRDIFEAAGLKDFGFVVLEDVFVLEMNGKEVKKTGFIAKGVKRE